MGGKKPEKKGGKKKERKLKSAAKEGEKWGTKRGGNDKSWITCKYEFPARNDN